MAENVIEYFNLMKKDDSAVVRILHTSVKTIEQSDVHFIDVGGKKKSVKCNGEGCRICKTVGDSPREKASHRIFIHLWDYTDNKEKVWSRTDKILPQLETLENDWGNLNDCVVRITRDTDEFPKYSINVMPAKNYAVAGGDLVDQKIAYRFYMTRSNEELDEFYKTGTMPSHKSTYVSKEEYFKNKNNQSNNDTKTEMNYTSKESPAFEDVDDDSLPF